MSKDAQDAIGSFSRHNATKAALMLSILIAIIASPFVEQQRWPFSYPIDPTIYREINRLRGLSEDALKWRFTWELRNAARATSGGIISCQYNVVLGTTPDGLDIRSEARWNWLSPMVAASGWTGINRLRGDDTTPHGITIRTTDLEESATCGSALQKSLVDIWGTTFEVSLHDKQTSLLLSTCQNKCIEIDIND